MAWKIGPFTFGSPYAEKQAAQAREEQSELAKLMAAQFQQYQPQINEQLWRQAQETPAWLARAWQQQRDEVMRAGESTLGNTLARLQATGMMRSGQASSALAGVGRAQSEALAEARTRNLMLGDERQRQLLAMLGGQVNPMGAQAASLYGQVGTGWGQAAQQAMQPFSSLLGLAGYGLTGGFRKGTPGTTGAAGGAGYPGGASNYPTGPYYGFGAGLPGYVSFPGYGP